MNFNTVTDLGQKVSGYQCCVWAEKGGLNLNKKRTGRVGNWGVLQRCGINLKYDFDMEKTDQNYVCYNNNYQKQP